MAKVQSRDNTVMLSWVGEKGMVCMMLGMPSNGISISAAFTDFLQQIDGSLSAEFPQKTHFMRSTSLLECESRTLSQRTRMTLKMKKVFSWKVMIEEFDQ